MSKFILGQIGSPRDYNVVKFLFKENLLDQLIVDTYFSNDSILAKLPFLGSTLAEKLRKYNVGLPLNKVSYDWAGALKMRYLLKYYSNNQAFSYANKRLGKRLIAYAANKTPQKYYGFDTSSLEFLKWGTGKGWQGYLEQCVAPRSSQIAMWKLFKEKYDLNIDKYVDHCLFQQDRERQEWQFAHTIIVPSDYVKNELVSDRGVDINKVNVVHYGYTPTKDKQSIARAIEYKTSQKDKTINLIFVGNTGYRKGIADLITLAEILKNENINFLIAGKMEEEASRMISGHKHGNVTYLGKLSKEQLAEQYLAADIFFFPSYLEGSAMVLQEAMGWGLPIITSYQSGSVAIDGVNGFLCNSGDNESFRKNILKLADDADLRYKMSINSLEISANYTVEEYGKNLLKVLTR